MEIDKKFIIDLKGKEYIKYDGLRDIAEQMGLMSLEVKLIQAPHAENGNMAICSARLEGKNNNGDVVVFTEVGDATPQNCNRMVAPHIVRMAATRAKGRALRDYTNVGMVCFEELLTDDDYKKQPSEKPQKQNESKNMSKEERVKGLMDYWTAAKPPMSIESFKKIYHAYPEDFNDTEFEICRNAYRIYNENDDINSEAAHKLAFKDWGEAQDGDVEEEQAELVG